VLRLAKAIDSHVVLKADGLGATEIADALNIGRSSVYRVLEASR
jgi:hypothetical protein